MYMKFLSLFHKGLKRRRLRGRLILASGSFYPHECVILQTTNVCKHLGVSAYQRLMGVGMPVACGFHDEVFASGLRNEIYM